MSSNIEAGSKNTYNQIITIIEEEEEFPYLLSTLFLAKLVNKADIDELRQFRGDADYKKRKSKL